MKTSIYWSSKFDLEYQTFEYWQLTLYGLYFWSRFAVSHPMYMENPIFLEIWGNFRGEGSDKWSIRLSFTVICGNCTWLSWTTFILIFWCMNHWYATTLSENILRIEKKFKIFKNCQNAVFWLFFRHRLIDSVIWLVYCDTKCQIDFDLHFWEYLD